MNNGITYEFLGAGTSWGLKQRDSRPVRSVQAYLEHPAEPAYGTSRDATYLLNIGLRFWMTPDVTSQAEAFEIQAPPLWLNDIYSLVASEKPDEAIDILFDHFDDLMVEGDFDRCDGLLHTIDENRLDTNLLVAALSISLSAAEFLPSRPSFVDRVERRLRTLAPDRIEGLMRGVR